MVNERRKQRCLTDPAYHKALKEKQRAYWHANKVRLLAEAKARYAADPEAKARKYESSKAWARRERERVNAAERERYAKDRERHRAECSERQKKYWKALMACPIRAETRREQQRAYRKQRAELEKTLRAAAELRHAEPGSSGKSKRSRQRPLRVA